MVFVGTFTEDIIHATMSINAKNLNYDSHEPAFLRRLRGEVGRQNSVRHERQFARPKKKMNVYEEDDDAPTYVDEASHEVVPKDEFEALVNRKEDTNQADNDRALPDEEQPKQGNGQNKPPTSGEQIASVGKSFKSRSAKIVGDEDVRQPESATEGLERTRTAKTKRNKKIKLSFDE
ncbi:MAG: hypothetical protein Q9191_003991 [Dirinaria sp. TL-2023a]